MSERDISKDVDLLPFEPPRNETIGFAKDLPEPQFEEEKIKTVRVKPFKTVKGNYKVVGRIRPLPFKIQEE